MPFRKYAHDGPVTLLSFSSHASRLASASPVSPVRIWDASSGALLCEIPLSQSPITGLSISANGRCLLVAQWDGSLTTWDIDSVTCLSSLRTHTGRIFCCAMNGSGGRAFSGGDDSTVRIWDLQTGQKLAELRGHYEGVSAVAATADGTLLLSGGRDGQLILWRSPSGECLGHLCAHKSGVTDVQLAGNGRIGLSCGSAFVWDMVTQSQILDLGPRVFKASLLPDGTRVVGVDADHNLRIWDLQSGVCVQLIPGNQEHIGCLCTGSCGALAATGDSSGTIMIWDLTQSRAIHSLHPGKPFADLAGEGDTANRHPPFLKPEHREIESRVYHAQDYELSSSERGRLVDRRVSHIYLDPDRFRTTPADPSLEELQRHASAYQGKHGAFEDGTTGDRDHVDCTVFAPPEVRPHDSVLVQVYVHCPESSEEAQQFAQAADSDTERRASRSLGTQIKCGTELSFEFDMARAFVDEPIQTLTWRGRTDCVQFGVTFPEMIPDCKLNGCVRISQQTTPIGTIRFSLKVVSGSGKIDRLPVATGTAKRYNLAFISYASRDRPEVMKRVQMLSAVGIHYFQDVMNLDPGDRWAQALFRHIDESDVMFLFWSSAAKTSEWVQKEWEYGLDKHGDEFVLPVTIEGPPIPEPPDRLRHLHFADRVLYFVNET